MVHFNISVAVKRRRDNNKVKKGKPLLILVFSVTKINDEKFIAISTSIILPEIISAISKNVLKKS